MKSRYLLYCIFTVVFLTLGWSVLVFWPLVPVSELTLDVLGGFLDAVRPLHATVSDSDSLRLRPMPYPGAPDDSKSPARPPWKPYVNESYDVFTHTYVVSLPHRMDRRVGMEQLREVLAVNWTYVDAVGAGDASVSRLMGCARDRARMSSSTDVFDWPKTSERDSILDAQDKLSWCPEVADTRPVVGLSNEETPPLTCARRDATRGPPFDPSLPPYMLLTPAKFACWSSHLQVLERFIFNRGSASRTGVRDVAVILEDDVNMERDIQARLAFLMDELPAEWDMLFLGHCWSDETHNTAIASYRNTSIHPSYSPKCTHAYAVTRSGAMKLLRHLRYPPFAYSRALDQAFAWLVKSGRIVSYSVVPSVVVQRKVASSDVDGGVDGLGSEWRDTLIDGILHG